MAYEESVADRVRQVLKGRRGVTERKMFGGIAFMLRGHMCCGVIGRDLMLRLGEEKAALARKERHVREMDFTGKPMKSMVYVAPAGYRAYADLQRWIGRAVDFVETLPAK